MKPRKKWTTSGPNSPLAAAPTGAVAWLTDKYGLSWQIIPKILGQLLGHSDPQIAQRAMKAMLQMTKIDIKKLQDAAAEAKSTATSSS